MVDRQSSDSKLSRKEPFCKGQQCHLDGSRSVFKTRFDNLTIVKNFCEF